MCHMSCFPYYYLSSLTKPSRWDTVSHFWRENSSALEEAQIVSTQGTLMNWIRDPRHEMDHRKSGSLEAAAEACSGCLKACVEAIGAHIGYRALWFNIIRLSSSKKTSEMLCFNGNSVPQTHSKLLKPLRFKTINSERWKKIQASTNDTGLESFNS